MNSYTGSAFCRYNIFIPNSLNTTGITISAPATLNQIPISQALGPISSINPMKTSVPSAAYPWSIANVDKSASNAESQ